MFSNYKAQFEKDLSDIREAGMYKEEKVIESKQGVEITIIDKYRPSASAEGDKLTLVNFCGNNYLGLAGSSDLAAAAKDGIDQYGFGMASVAFISGTGTVHKDLEAEVARFF